MCLIDMYDIVLGRGVRDTSKVENGGPWHQKDWEALVYIIESFH
jgi:hypothetical protein